MNATETPDKNNPRTRRIKIFSQILKALVLIYMVVIPLISIMYPAIERFVMVHFILLPGQTMGPVRSHADPPTTPAIMKLTDALTITIYLLGALVFYRLLNLYERGIVFSPANVRLFRLMGYLAICKGLATVTGLAGSYGDFSFELVFLNIFCSCWVIGGLFGIMISLIMEEGCKLREEQEFTV